MLFVILFRFVLGSLGMFLIALDIEALTMLGETSIKELLLMRQAEILSIADSFYLQVNELQSQNSYFLTASKSISLMMSVILFDILPTESLLLFLIVYLTLHLTAIVEYISAFISFIFYVFSFKWLIRFEIHLLLEELTNFFFITLRFIGRFKLKIVVFILSYLDLFVDTFNYFFMNISAEKLENGINTLINTINITNPFI